MNADAVSFPKGVFPPDADFGKGDSVPMTHDGSGGCPTLWGDSFEFDYAFGIIKLFFLCSRQKSTVLNVPQTFGVYTSNTSEFATAAACQGQRTLLNKKAVPAGRSGENRKINLTNQRTGICNSPHSPQLHVCQHPRVIRTPDLLVENQHLKTLADGIVGREDVVEGEAVAAHRVAEVVV